MNGIIHRDIKSANIVIDANSQPKIIDFGIAVYKHAKGYSWAGSTRRNMHRFFMSGNRVKLPTECPAPLAELTAECWKINPEERPTASKAEQAIEKGLDLFRMQKR